MRLLTVAAFAVLFGGVTVAPQQQVYDVGDGVSSPVPISQAKADYTPQAKAERIQGSVWLSSVVLEDGTVSDVRVTRSLHPDLDEQAIAALKRWEFKPGMREGKPVAVRITCEFTFTLK